jgi:hypothetical protein
VNLLCKVIADDQNNKRTFKSHEPEESIGIQILAKKEIKKKTKKFVSKTLFVELKI